MSITRTRQQVLWLSLTFGSSHDSGQRSSFVIPEKRSRSDTFASRPIVAFAPFILLLACLQVGSSHVSCIGTDRSRSIAKNTWLLHRNALTPSPTLYVSKSSINPAPKHSSLIQSNDKPLRLFHFFVLAGTTVENSPRILLATDT